MARGAAVGVSYYEVKLKYGCHVVGGHTRKKEETWVPDGRGLSNGLTSDGMDLHRYFKQATRIPPFSPTTIHR